jgi:hypothetical protein
MDEIMKVDITSGTLSAALISASVLVAWVPTHGESSDTKSSTGMAMEGSAATSHGHGAGPTSAPAAPVLAGLAVTTSHRTSNADATWRQR